MTAVGINGMRFGRKRLSDALIENQALATVDNGPAVDIGTIQCLVCRVMFEPFQLPISGRWVQESGLLEHGVCYRCEENTPASSYQPPPADMPF